MKIKAIILALLLVLAVSCSTTKSTSDYDDVYSTVDVDRVDVNVSYSANLARFYGPYVGYSYYSPMYFGYYYDMWYWESYPYYPSYYFGYSWCPSGIYWGYPYFYYPYYNVWNDWYYDYDKYHYYGHRANQKGSGNSNTLVKKNYSENHQVISKPQVGTQKTQGYRKFEQYNSKSYSRPSPTYQNTIKHSVNQVPRSSFNSQPARPSVKYSTPSRVSSIRK